MPNLRLLADNAADRATLTATNTVPSMPASNMLIDVKSRVCRTTLTTTQLTLTWPTTEPVSMVALPFNNLTGTSTIRARAYADVNDVVGSAPVLADSGIATAVRHVPAPPGGLPPGVNSFAFGGGHYAVCYFAQANARKLVVDIADVNNPAGYLELSRIVAGRYWEPQVNAEVGVQVKFIDASEHSRADSSDLRTERGSRARRVVFDLRMMKAPDRNAMWNVLAGNGMAVPMFFSLSPEATDSGEEGLFQVYAKLADAGSITYQFANAFGTSLELEEV